MNNNKEMCIPIGSHFDFCELKEKIKEHNLDEETVSFVCETDKEQNLFGEYYEFATVYLYGKTKNE